MIGKRVFDIDIDIAHCPHCGGQLKLIAAIEEPAAIARIFTRLGLAAQPPPRAPAVRVDLFQAALGVNPDWMLTGPGEVFGPSAFNRLAYVEIGRIAAQSCLRC